MNVYSLNCHEHFNSVYRQGCKTECYNKVFQAFSTLNDVSNKNNDYLDMCSQIKHN